MNMRVVRHLLFCAMLVSASLGLGIYLLALAFYARGGEVAQVVFLCWFAMGGAVISGICSTLLEEYVQPACVIIRHCEVIQQAKIRDR